MPYVRRMASQHIPLYHYRVKDKIVGPVSLADLHALLTSKKILPDTMIREEHSQGWMPLTAELRRQERLARLRASAFILSCRPPKSCFLFYIIALLLLACGVAHSIMLHSILYMEVLFVPVTALFMGKVLMYMHLLTGGIRKMPAEEKEH